MIFAETFAGFWRDIAVLFKRHITDVFISPAEIENVLNLLQFLKFFLRVAFYRALHAGLIIFMSFCVD